MKVKEMWNDALWYLQSSVVGKLCSLYRKLFKKDGKQDFNRINWSDNCVFIIYRYSYYCYLLLILFFLGSVNKIQEVKLVLIKLFHQIENEG